jgi:hypothetical protein
MKNVFNVQVKNGGIQFSSDYHKGMWDKFLKENDGMRLKITPDEQIATQVRRFFEGAVVPYFALQHFVQGRNGRWTVMDAEMARACLKEEFLPYYYYDIHGKLVQGSKSTADCNKEEFRQFLDRILDWFMQNGYEFPEPEPYKQWVDSQLEINVLYPPLQRLKDVAIKKLAELNHEKNK